MHKRLVILFLIILFSFYCSACGKTAFQNQETEVQEQYLQEEDSSNVCSTLSGDTSTTAENNKAENWTVKVAQQVLALAIWHGIKQTIHIIFWKRIKHP